MERLNITELVGQYTSQLSNKWRWFVFIGIVLIVIGMVAFSHQIFTTLFSVYYLVSLLFISGFLQIIQAFQMRPAGRAFYIGGSGLLYVLAAVLAFLNPLFTTTMLTLLIAIALFVAGFIRMWEGFKNRHLLGSPWLMFSGLITLLLGIMIATGWPSNALWIIGMFVGIDLVFQGWSCLALGLTLRKSRR